MRQDLRFYGHYIHEQDGFERAKALIGQEMRERQPDHLSPSGYAPDDDFKKALSTFSTDFRAFGRELKSQLLSGRSVSPEDITTLERAEKLYVLGSTGDPKTTAARLSLLDAGHAVFGSGMSDSHMIRKLAGRDGERSYAERGMQVSVDFGVRR